ncbi:hypothetical protein [Niallia circulans]|uniref:Uncharacterized protein n=1 Tax=Niallia circulans TaxID=1397 RepID=A0A941GEE1_NIACI|nr:hypothetical protein [Niallia circulans]MCB5235893.1 hypothetical protein [Niallia circulans]
MENTLRPNNAEILFLNMAYNKFYDVYEEAFQDIFWDKDPLYRFSKINTAFSIYAELLNYEPIKHVIKTMKQQRPPMEAELGSELFKFIRNVLAHFPYFESWNDVWINKSIVNWQKPGLTIDRFLSKYAGKESIKYRFWEAKKKKMTYLTISFPKTYSAENKIYLHNILSEKDGIKFSLILMRNILDTQVILE